MKKLLLTLGAVASVAAPVAAVVACSSDTDGGETTLSSNVTSSSDKATLTALDFTDTADLSVAFTQLNITDSVPTVADIKSIHWDKDSLKLTVVTETVASADTVASKITYVYNVKTTEAPISGTPGPQTGTVANDMAINLSVKAGVRPDLTKLPTTSWYSTDDWDRNLFLFEKQTKALEEVLEATGTTLVVDGKTEIAELKGLKAVLLDIVKSAASHDDDLYKGISRGFKLNPTLPGGAATADILPDNSIELMAHDGPYKSTDEAKTAFKEDPADRGFTHPANIFLEILYIPTDEIGTFLDNLDKKVQAFTTNGSVTLTDDEKKVWNVIYKESKRAI